MKYRVLNKEELEPLNEEFLKYLMVANITPQIWEQLKKDNKEACQIHLETFSDLVFDKVLSELRFIEVVNENRVEVYQTLNESMHMFAIENKSLGQFNFQKEDWTSLDLTKVNIIQGNKKYTDREKELFALLQKENAGISNGELFKKVALLSVSK